MSEETKPAVFISFCTFPFDPAKKSDCYQMCKDDEPEEFARCLKHFEESDIKPKAPTKAKSGGKGKSFWGHVKGSQAGLIDDCLVEATKPVTIQEIAEFAGSKLPRTLHHIKHLATNKGVTISLTSDKCIFWNENPNMTGLEAHGCVTGLTLRKNAVNDNTRIKAKPKPEALKDAEEAKCLRDAEEAIEEEERAALLEDAEKE